jgi:hypothetical protein
VTNIFQNDDFEKYEVEIPTPSAPNLDLQNKLANIESHEKHFQSHDSYDDAKNSPRELIFDLDKKLTNQNKDQSSRTGLCFYRDTFSLRESACQVARKVQQITVWRISDR